jgi:DNA-binding PadR family transcriptional regulator
VALFEADRPGPFRSDSLLTYSVPRSETVSVARSFRVADRRLRRENDPPLLVLLSLAGGPKHGHALMKDIEQFAGVRLGPGTLYSAIERLEGEGLIEALEPDGSRRPYRITEAGAISLERILCELDEIVEAGRARLVVLRSDLSVL